MVAVCASTPSSGPPTAPNGGRALADDANAPPPDGSKRLPSSIACEPEPPCEDCVVVKGERARHVGSLDKEVIRGVIRSHADEVRTCYDAVALTRPDARGKMMIRFGIAASGIVAASCLVTSELSEPAVERCVVDLPLGWTFPPPDGGGWVVVSYPFVFSR